MVVSIHQPNYLPWSGFFHKMSKSDTFVLLDNVSYTKNGFQNRTRIRTLQGASWLTVPVLSKGRFRQLTSEVEIDNRTDWRKKHWLSLQTHYGGAPYFHLYSGWLEGLYCKSWVRLVELNTALIQYLAEQLGIQAVLILASKLGCSGKGTQLLLNICQTMKGDVYLAGPSGRSYLEQEKFLEAGVSVRFHEFHHPTYQQRFGTFLPGMSVLDLLFNHGPESLAILRG